MTTAGLLAGLSVVELVTFVAGPLCGTTLAGLGADVLRIDPLGGSADRDRWPVTDTGRSIYWSSLNRGKQSATLDLRSARGQDVLTELVRRTGVFVTNSARPWHSYEALSAVRPDLIMVRITGRHDGAAAVDYTVNAKLGIPYLTGPPGSDPVSHSLPAWDISCGLYAALAVVSAVRRRDATGAGANIVIPLENVGAGLLGQLGYLAEVQLTGRGRERVGNDVYGTFGHDFPTADGRVMVVALSNRHWRDLLAVTGTTDAVDALAADLGVDFTTEANRFRHRARLIALMAPWFAARPTAAVLTELADTSVLAERFQTTEQYVTGGQLGENPLFRALDQVGLGTYLAAGVPLDIDGSYPQAGPAPVLGEDTPDVLARAGLTPDEVTHLVDEWGLVTDSDKESQP
ncbi:CoA transferase [Granulicoccus phenolivorans]|uniref:CoA transferase n=1 Tax=Granulicoccus phenolivorans TaxID=266854 RepID=UPI000408F7A3|nr:CoA transferase [Granulicoccus phenolivorans]